MRRRRGTVARWAKSWGFITSDVAGEPDWFVHQTEVRMDGFRRLEVGDYVTFEIGEDSNGRPCAVAVEKRYA